jgi:hypothetical protein
MSGETKTRADSPGRTARFYLWTIRRQDRIRYVISLNVWIYVYMLLVLAVFTPLSLDTALQILLFSGLAIAGGLWALIERRRSWLLSIRDARLRESAHQVMIDYIRKKTRAV